jgi:hypothetical protein
MSNSTGRRIISKRSTSVDAGVDEVVAVLEAAVIVEGTRLLRRMDVHNRANGSAYMVQLSNVAADSVAFAMIVVVPRSGT